MSRKPLFVSSSVSHLSFVAPIDPSQLFSFGYAPEAILLAESLSPRLQRWYKPLSPPIGTLTFCWCQITYFVTHRHQGKYMPVPTVWPQNVRTLPWTSAQQCIRLLGQLIFLTHICRNWSSAKQSNFKSLTDNHLES